MSETKITFHQNMAIEFLTSIIRYTLKDKIFSKEFKKNEEILAWEKSVDERISPFFKNDLLILKRINNILWTLLNMCFTVKVMDRKKF